MELDAHYSTLTPYCISIITHTSMLVNKKWRNNMSIPVQKGFWRDNFLANTRIKMSELYYIDPDAMKSEKQCMLAFWSQYEQLDSILGDKWEAFQDWFNGCTSTETITRCMRSLKEDGTVSVTPNDNSRRRDNAEGWCRYWGNEKRLEEGE
ncbi:hypothetical protein ACFLTJ_02445 [Chloroflexota bacterium]